jgi:hypothetical protein
MSCQHKFILKLGNVLDGYDVSTMVLMDPAGLPFINSRSTIGAGGLSGVIYKTYQLLSFPLNVRDKIKDELFACYHDYTKPSSDIPKKQVRLIHAVGPRLTVKTQDEHLEKLTTVYTNIFSEFLEHCEPETTLRLVPISSGIFNEIKYSPQELADLSLLALFVGLNNAESVQGRKAKNIELWVVERPMFDAFLAQLRTNGLTPLKKN